MRVDHEKSNYTLPVVQSPPVFEESARRIIAVSTSSSNPFGVNGAHKAAAALANNARREGQVP
jgi:hypothetical protein